MKARRRPKKYIFGLAITDRAELVRVVNVKRERRRRRRTRTGRFSGRLRNDDAKPSHFKPMKTNKGKTLKRTENQMSEIQEPSKQDDIPIHSSIPMSRTVLPTRGREHPPSPHSRARPVSGYGTLKKNNRKSRKNWDTSTILIDTEMYDRNRKTHERKVRRIMKRKKRRPVNGLILPDDERCKGELKEFRKCNYTPPQEPVRRTIDIQFRTESRSLHHKLRVKNIAPSPRTLGRRR